jgi:hypothetical protein
MCHNVVYFTHHLGYELRAAAHIKDDVQEAVTRGIEEGVTRVMRKNMFRKKIHAIDQLPLRSEGLLRIYPGDGPAQDGSDMKGEHRDIWLLQSRSMRWVLI